MIDIDVIMASKLYKMSSLERKTTILNYFNAKLEVQDPEDVDTVSTDTESVDMDDIVEDKERDEKRDDLEDDLNKDRAELTDKKDKSSKKPNNSDSDDAIKEPADNKRPTDESNPRSGRGGGHMPLEEASDMSSLEVGSSSESIDSQSAVMASLPRTHVTDNMNLEVLDIKELLNLNDSTSGVNRVEVKNDSELWVYYNDNVNTGSIMIDVISLLNRPGYTYLEFNRLARSNNAIVFYINNEDTDYRKKLESEIAETKNTEEKE